MNLISARGAAASQRTTEAMATLEKSASTASQTVREAFRGLPRIPWVAKWFTAGQAALKLMQLASPVPPRAAAAGSSDNVTLLL